MHLFYAIMVRSNVATTKRCICCIDFSFHFFDHGSSLFIPHGILRKFNKKIFFLLIFDGVAGKTH